MFGKGSLGTSQPRPALRPDADSEEEDEEAGKRPAGLA